MNRSLFDDCYGALWPLTLALTFALTGATTACVDGAGEPPPLHPPPTGPLACDQSEDFASVDFAGMWHFEAIYDDFPGAGLATLRVFGQPGDYSALANGREPTTAVLDQSGVHIELIEDSTADGGSLITRTYDICAIDDTATATGRFEFCRDDDCFSATLSGRQLFPLDEPVADGISLISEYNGENSAWAASSLTMNVRVQDNMAYVARRFDGFRLVDLTDIANPFERAHLPVMYQDAEFYNDIKVATGPSGTRYALLASNARGVVVIDVSNPDEPVEVTSFPGPELAPDGVPAVHTLFVEGDLAYVAYNFDDSLRIYDISDPAAPQALGQFRNDRLDEEYGTLHDLYVQDGMAYLNYWGLGMSVVDAATDPSAPVLLGEYRDYGEISSHSNWVTQAGGRSISVHGDEQYNAHVRIVDADPTSGEFLTTLGSYQTRPEVSVHNILAHGERAYVTYYQDGLRILDLSDPHNPTKVAHYHTWPGVDREGYGQSFFEGAIGVDYDPATGRIYVADTHRGILVLSEE